MEMVRDIKKLIALYKVKGKKRISHTLALTRGGGNEKTCLSCYKMY